MLDFEDAAVAPPVVEAAICAAYMIMGRPDPVQAATDLMQGFTVRFNGRLTGFECDGASPSPRHSTLDS